MPDRIIRDEILQSVRWGDLPTDTHRLVFVALVLRADDYGNIEGGPRRLYRWMVSFTQIKSEADSIKIMSDLQDADLIRRYEVESREFWHMPRFRNSRRYWSRNCPPSPYKEQQRIQTKQEVTENPSADLPQTCVNPSGGVGVGVGVGGVVVVKDCSSTKIKRVQTKKLAQAPFVLPEEIPKEQWEAWVEARTKARKAPTDFAKKLALAKLAELKEQGHHPAAVLAQSAFNGWAGLFPIKAKT